MSEGGADSGEPADLRQVAEPPSKQSFAREWLTIADAAERFRVSERALRRAVTRQTNADNAAGTRTQTRQVTRQTKTGPRSAAAFPADLLGRLAGDLSGDSEGNAQSVGPADNAAQTRPAAKPGFDGRQETVSERGANADTNAARNVDNAAANTDTNGSALVSQLRGEVDFLRAALDKEQENTRAALAELQRANERAAVIIGALGTGRLQIPGTAETETAGRVDANPPHGFTQEAHSGETGETVSATVPQSGQGQSVTQEEKRPFWASLVFWKTK